MKTLVKIILFILVLGLFGCQKESNSTNKDLISTKWYLQGIQFTDTQTENLVPENLAGMNIVFSDSNKLHAISSCNVFDGNFITSGSNLINIDAATTLIYCTDFNKRLWDSLFYHNLNNSNKYDLKNGILFIQTTKNTVLIFK
jgi:heat shock protein HslJ